MGVSTSKLAMLKVKIDNGLVTKHAVHKLLKANDEILIIIINKSKSSKTGIDAFTKFRKKGILRKYLAQVLKTLIDAKPNKSCRRVKGKTAANTQAGSGLRQSTARQSTQASHSQAKARCRSLTSSQSTRA